MRIVLTSTPERGRCADLHQDVSLKRRKDGVPYIRYLSTVVINVHRDNIFVQTDEVLVSAIPDSVALQLLKNSRVAGPSQTAVPFVGVIGAIVVAAAASIGNAGAAQAKGIIVSYRNNKKAPASFVLCGSPAEIDAVLAAVQDSRKRTFQTPLTLAEAFSELEYQLLGLPPEFPPPFALLRANSTESPFKPTDSPLYERMAANGGYVHELWRHCMKCKKADAVDFLEKIPQTLSAAAVSDADTRISSLKRRLIIGVTMVLFSWGIVALNIHRGSDYGFLSFLLRILGLVSIAFAIWNIEELLKARSIVFRFRRHQSARSNT